MKNKGSRIFKILNALAMALVLTVSMAACGASEAAADEEEEVQVVESGDTVITEANVTSDGEIDATDLFTERDLTQTADLTEAVYYTLEDGRDIEITEAGVYVISGTAEEVTITVDAGDDDKVQIVLNGTDITNGTEPAIYVKNADKVFVTTTETENSLKVTGEFTADGDTNTNAVIFSKDDLVINGLGTLEIESTDHGVVSKDDLKVTGGNLKITCTGSALKANDSVAVADGTFELNPGKDGIHAENDDDNTLGYVYICGGAFVINAGDDGIHGTTIVEIDGGTYDISAVECIEATVIQINDGTFNLESTDDAINASEKSTAFSMKVEINGGDITISMAQGDTDGVDSNGDLIINGGTLNISAQSPFDFDGKAEHNGGTIIVNGEEIDEITSQFGGMEGGMMGGFGGPGQNGQDGQIGHGGPNGQNGQMPEPPEGGPNGQEGPEGQNGQMPEQPEEIQG